MTRLSDVRRTRYGAMQLSAPHIFSAPADPAEARRVLGRAIELVTQHRRSAAVA